MSTLYIVLDALRAAGFERQVCYWRDKSGREIDFQGEDLVVTPFDDTPSTRRIDGVEVRFVGITQIVAQSSQ